MNTPLIISNSIRTLDGSAVEFDASSSKQMRINMSIFLSINIATTEFYSVKHLEFDRSIDNKLNKILNERNAKAVQYKFRSGQNEIDHFVMIMIIQLSQRLTMLDDIIHHD